jgi:hypothetical protein
MSIFLRVFQHLLPRSPIWRLSFNKMLQKLFAGLAAGAPDAVRTYADLVFLDAFPATTRQLSMWRTQFGIEASADDDADRLQLDTAWKSQGGQDPNYLQTILQGAGFPLYVHEWWSSGPPYIARDPRTYTHHPLLGTFQCSPLSFGASQPACTHLGIGGAPACDNFLGNDPGYLVNEDLTRRPPPAVPDDPLTWPYFFYLGGAAFPDRVSVPASRRAELERLVLKLRPTHQWVVMLVDYDPAIVLDDGTPVVLDDGTIVTL